MFVVILKGFWCKAIGIERFSWFGLLLTLAISMNPSETFGSERLLNQGKLVFEGACAFCHSTSRAEGVLVGPNLAGVFERRVGSENFPYSQAFKRLSGSWTTEALSQWLSRPMEVAPGTAMTFQGLSNSGDLLAVIAYLKQN